MRVIWFLINLVLSISVCSIPIIAVGLFDKDQIHTFKDTVKSLKMTGMPKCFLKQYLDKRIFL